MIISSVKILYCDLFINFKVQVFAIYVILRVVRTYFGTASDGGIAAVLLQENLRNSGPGNNDSSQSYTSSVLASPLKSLSLVTNTAQKLKFSIKDLFSKCDQIRSFLRIWSHLLKKSLMENFIFWAVHIGCLFKIRQKYRISYRNSRISDCFGILFIRASYNQRYLSMLCQFLSFSFAAL